jgi:preprotein translocase subunit SecD
MRNIASWRIILTILVTFLGAIFAAPNFVQVKTGIFPSKSVNLGLDLRGGSHLLLDVDLQHYLKDQYEMLADNLRKELKQEKIGYKNLKFLSNQVQLDLRNAEDFEGLRSVVKRLDKSIWIQDKDSKISLIFNNDRIAEMEQNVIDQSIEIVRMRVDETGTKEPIIQKQGDTQILLQVPGAENPAELKEMLGKTAKLTFHKVNDDANIDEAIKGRLPHDSMLLYMENGPHGQIPIVLKKKAFLTGDLLSDAQVSFNQHNQPAVSIWFNSLGGKIFADITKSNVGRRLAIVLDNKVISAANINEPIIGGNGSISGGFTIEGANELALLLRAGALPAPLKIIEERTIGPSLGADSIEAGKKAGMVGFGLVIIFMIWSYGILGLFANIALSLALLYILAMLSMFQATLTLPGIAAIILTIGMAVDANILIYERIREELHKGASNLFAIKQGFESALGTITDSNITTLIAAFLLYIFGAGAVKGFAVSLTIGIIASMFTAITVTKLFVDLWMRFVDPKDLGLE